MSQEVNVLVSTRKLSNERMELVLEAMEGVSARWSKIYDGSLFLSMDAQSLGLLEPVANAPSSGPKFRLRRSGKVQRGLLLRMRFAETQGPATQGR